MATPKFEYPMTGEDATVTLEFTRGDLAGDGRYPVANQITDDSESMALQAVSLGDDYYEHVFTVQVPIADQSGDTADVTKVLSFVTSTVGWSLRPFYFTDSNGTAYLVKLLNKDLKPARRYVSYNEYQFLLREVSS